MNSLAYLTPPLALAWLAVFLGLGVPRPGLLLAGAAVIVSVNLFLNFRTVLRR